MAPNPSVQCTGFVARLGTDATPPVVLDALARDVRARTLGADWRDEPVTLDGRTRRFWRVGEENVPLPEAWSTLRELRKDRDVASAELDLFQPGIEPPLVSEAYANKASPASGLFSTEDLPGSEPRLWSLDLCNVRKAWELVPKHGKQQGKGTLIVHPDTGYTLHPELMRDGGGVDRKRAKDFVDEQGRGVDPLDPGLGRVPGHGTGTASVIMGDLDEHPGVSDVTGVAPAASLIPLRVSRSVIHLSFSRLVAAIDYAISIDCHVISMSLGGPVTSSALERVVRRAVNAGIIVVAAAGNYWPAVVYPAALPDVIAVAACNAEGKIWRHSTRGREVDVTGPGESVWTARSERGARPFGEARSSGTSHATATVAGACALWLAFHGREWLIGKYGRPNLAAVFKEVLSTKGVRRPPSIDWKSGLFGAGLIDAAALLLAGLPDTAPAGNLLSLAAALPSDRPSGVLGEISRLLPDVPPERLRGRLRRLLGASEAEFPGLLREHGEELVLLAALDPATREALGEKRGREVVGLAPAAVVAARMSRPAARSTSRLVSRRLSRRLTAAAHAKG